MRLSSDELCSELSHAASQRNNTLQYSISIIIIIIIITDIIHHLTAVTLRCTINIYDDKRLTTAC